MIRANEAIIINDYCVFRRDDGTNPNGLTIFGIKIVDYNIKGKLLLYKPELPINANIYVYNVMKGAIDFKGKEFTAIYGHMLTSSEVFLVSESDTFYCSYKLDDLSMEIIKYINALMQGVGEGLDDD